MKYFLGSILACLAVAGCSHSVVLPGSLQQWPEVAGRLGGGDFNLGLEQTIEFEIFIDITTNPPVRSTANGVGLFEAVMPVLPSGSFSLGILSNVDFYATGAYGARWMFWGTPREDGWRSTVFVGAISGSESSSSLSGGTITAETKLDGTEYGFSVGKLISKKFLVYGTLGQQKGQGKTTIVQPTQTFKYNDDYEHSLLTMGTTIGEKAYFLVEVSAFETKWKPATGLSMKDSGTSYLFGGGFKW